MDCSSSSWEEPTGRQRLQIVSTAKQTQEALKAVLKIQPALKRSSLDLEKKNHFGAKSNIRTHGWCEIKVFQYQLSLSISELKETNKKTQF